MFSVSKQLAHGKPTLNILFFAFFGFALFLCTSFVFAQTATTSLPKLIPPTPNAASLGKYGDVEIGLYTGQPNVSFPLYEIKYNDLSIPIVLSYNYSGLKVEEYPSWVGTGWTILGTGVINRQTRGIADEGSEGFNGQFRNGLKVLNFINGGSVVTPANQLFVDGVRRGQFDSEPDMFTFSLPGGLSGKFFFDETQNVFTIKKAITIPDQRISVTGYFNYSGIYNVRPGVIEKFVIVDQKGIRYTFEVVEKASGLEPGEPHENDFASSWYLTSIDTPNGNNVSYQYRFRILDMPATMSETRTIVLKDFPGYDLPDMSPKKDFAAVSTTEAVLERINFRGGYIKFDEGDIRQDWNSNAWVYTRARAVEQPKSLGQINVWLEGEMVKQFKFEYGYFGNSVRLRLDRFYEVNGSQKGPSHSFEYQDGIFPIIGDHNSLTRQDHWGYFRSELSTSLLPPFNYFIAFADGRRDFASVPGNSREPSDAAAAGLLTKIIYPTGGYTKIQYEPNQYWGAPKTSFCNGKFFLDSSPRASVSVGEQTRIDTIYVGAPTCAKIEHELITPCIDGEANALLVDGNGVVIYEHVQGRKAFGLWESHKGPAAGKAFELASGVYYLSTWVVNENSCGSLTMAKASLSRILQDSTGYANLSAGGFRVSSLSDCNNENDCVDKYMSYTDPTNINKSSGYLVTDPVYHYFIEYAVSEDGGGTVNRVKCAELNAQSLVPIASTSGSIVGYNSVTVRKDSAGVIGKTVYSFLSPKEHADLGSMEYPFVPQLSYEWKRGKEIRKSVYARDGSQDILIQDDSLDFIHPQTFSRSLGFRLKRWLATNTIFHSVTLDDYTFVPYSIVSGYTQLNIKKESIFAPPGSPVAKLSKLTSYSYENPLHLLPTKVISKSSTGQVEESRMKYIEDLSSINGLTDSERAGIQANPDKTALVEKSVITDAVVLSTERIIYDGPRLKQVLVALRGNPFEDFLRANKYDSKGNLLSYTERNGVTTAHIFDGVQKNVIAEVKNAAPENIFYTSFEDNGAPDPLAKTGDRVFLGDYTFNPPSGFIATDNSILSYWHWSNNTWQYKEQVYSGGVVVLTDGDKIDEVRIRPTSALMTTYTYRRGVGVSSITDVNNKTTTYEYDSLGRLIVIRDHNKKIISNFVYNFKR